MIELLRAILTAAGVDPDQRTTQAFGLAVTATEPERTLRQVLNDLDSPEIAAIQASYQQGWSDLLDGRPAMIGFTGCRPRGSAQTNTCVGHPGFGNRPLSELTVDRLQELMSAVQAHAAVRYRARHGNAGPAGISPADGAGAARQVCYAARRLATLLKQRGVAQVRSLDALHAPRTAEVSRSRALTDCEATDYAAAVLLTSDDPALDAYVWYLFRLLALRRIEVLGLRDSDFSLQRGAVTVVGKGGGRREMPVPDPVLVLGAQALAGRPPAFNGAHLRNRDGRPLTRRHFERWSRVLHERGPWAQGHNLCLHCLRHSCAHLLRRRGLADSDIALWLGHDDRDRIGTTEVYLRLVGDEVWTRRGQIYRQAFGPLNRWPDLPETSVLGPIIRTVLMRPQTPTTSAIPATSSSAGPLGAPASSQPVGGAGAPQFLAPGSAPAGATEPAGNRPDSPTELGSKPLPGQDADAQRGPDQAAEDL